MDEIFAPAVEALARGDVPGLQRILAQAPDLATRRSSRSPRLLVRGADEELARFLDRAREPAGP